MPGVPVYDEQGELFADSVSAAARRLGCRQSSSFATNHLVDYRDGYQLKSRPSPHNVGRRGGPRAERRPVVGLSGERWNDVYEAAPLLGVTPGALRRLCVVRDGVYVLTHKPSTHGVNRLSRRYQEQAR